MSDHETQAAVPAYITGLSEFVRAHYERRFETLEQEFEELRRSVGIMEEKLAGLSGVKLSNAQLFYTAVVIEIAAAIEQALPFTKTAAVLWERANEVATMFTYEMCVSPAVQEQIKKWPK